MSWRNVPSWLRHLELLRRNHLTELWLLCGPQGCGKTSTANGITDLLQQNGFSVTPSPRASADVLFLDDLGKWFSKRDWNTKQGRVVARFVQVVRTLYTLVLTTSVAVADLDKSIRETPLLEILEVVSPGFALWRDPISVVPRWQSESWRRAVAVELADSLEKE